MPFQSRPTRIFHDPKLSDISQPWSHPTIKNSLIRRTAGTRDNTVICGAGESEPSEISQALRLCHATNQHESGTFGPCTGLKPPSAAKMARTVAR
jgi:hypothetical protein